MTKTDKQNDLSEAALALDQVQERMQKVADDAAEIARAAQDQDMEDIARQAEVLRQQVLAARNKVSLLAKKTS